MAPVVSTLRPATGLVDQGMRARAGVFLRPAMRAYMVGYLLDALPTLFKQLLRFVLVTLRDVRKVQKRIQLERADGNDTADIEQQQEKTTSDTTQQPQFEIRIPAAAPTTLYGDGIKPAMRQVPLLLKAMIKTLAAALGPRGVGAACAFTMASTAVLDIALIDALKRAGIGADPAAKRRGRLAAFSTFASAALASSTALYMLQRASVGADHDALKTNLSIANPFRRKNVNGEPGTGRGVPTPLAPGGHFLARLTTLSIPTTPRNEKGSRSPAERNPFPPALSPTQEKPGKSPGTQEIGTASPTIDLSLFALVRAMDTLARALPIVLAIRRPSSIDRTASTAVGPAGGMKTGTSRNRLAQIRNEASRSLVARAIQSIGSTVQTQAHGLAFVVACAIIMFNWFYHPERLPPTYVRWISNLASMDHRALQALRCLRHQKPFRYQYGDKGMDAEGINVLGSLAESLGHPYSWGDLSRLPIDRADAQKQKKAGSKQAIAAAQAAGKPLPEPYILEGAVGPRGRGQMGGVPCEVIHCGVGGGNCYKNAIYRFLRAWRMCLGIYVPVHLLPRVIFGPGQFKRQPVETITKVLVGSARSATFLSTFIACIWFMVCLGRSILLPRLFPSVSHRFWDHGLGPIMGSWTCGWSVFIEEPRKRAEMALYVAPRALFALAEMSRPGWLSRGKKSALQAERLMFGMSVGIVVAAARHRPDLLRGITALMAWIVAPPKLADGGKRVKATAPRT